MQTAWELLQSPQGPILHSSAVPLEVGGWSGEVDYRVGGREQKPAVDLQGGEEQAVGRERAWAHAGPLLSLTLRLHLDAEARWSGTLRNTSAQEIAVEGVCLRAQSVRLGATPGRYSFFKNGYQSWSLTRSYRAGERQRKVIVPALNVLQDNLRNLASGQPGHLTSDMFAVWGNLDARTYLLVGQVTGFRQFLYIRTQLSNDGKLPPTLELVFDLGGQVLPPGGELALDEVVLLADTHANRVQDRYWEMLQVPGVDSSELPTGWCSWYYYYTHVAAVDVRENVAAAHARQVDWRFFVLDDGYETAVGDWTSFNARFPHGLRPLAQEIAATGMAPGLWLAPFVARGNSRLFREHPEWLLHDAQGRPALAGWNPGWGLEGRFYGLDTTHPGFQEQLRAWTRAIVSEWGFRYLKLDFVYGASLYGEAHDRSLSPAQRLELGYRLIRETAGPDVFILGCGSPLSPARGLVDAMRIGPDVAPYWFAKYRFYLTNDEHAVCTRFAIRNVLNRCQLHRRLWVNDPDCLLLRDSDTKLTPYERQSLANAVIVSGGMYVISDRLARLSNATWQQMAEVERLARACDHGRAWALDYMERETPELIYNSRGYLAAFNMANHPARKRVDLLAYLEGLVERDARFRDVWSGEEWQAVDGVLDIGELAPHASRLLAV